MIVRKQPEIFGDSLTMRMADSQMSLVLSRYRDKPGSTDSLCESGARLGSGCVSDGRGGLWAGDGIGQSRGGGSAAFPGMPVGVPAESQGA